ncbi:phosphopeptide-binding protein [Streptomyces sp. GKU 895]|nr:phosphopeptide-binding protein [Streptomyces sp. GKU 895]
MPTCPNGHQSGSDDWCEVCGHRMAGAVPPPLPAAPGGGYGFPPPPPGAGGQPGRSHLSAVPDPEPELCPQCRTPREGGAPFCEECRWNFLTNTATSYTPAAPRPPAPGPGVRFQGPPPGASYGGGDSYEYQGSRPSQMNRPAEPIPPFGSERQGQDGPGGPGGPNGPGGFGAQGGPGGPGGGGPGGPGAFGGPGGPEGPGGFGGPNGPGGPGGPGGPNRPGGYGTQGGPGSPGGPNGPGGFGTQGGPGGPGGPNGPGGFGGPGGQGGPGGYGYPQPGSTQAPPGPGFQQRPAGPATWTATIGPDREYFMAMMQRSGPEAAGLNLPAYSPEQQRTLTGNQVTIGRRRHSTGDTPDIDLSVPPEDPGVSHQHAVLVQQPDGSWAVVDQNSTNGTTVNGAEEPIQPFVPVPLQDGDRVHVGAWTTITVRRG